MKRILLACILLTATCTVFSVQHAAAQVTQASFTVKVNALDSLIGINDMTDAQAMWSSINTDMISVLGVSKAAIANAATPAIAASYNTIIQNQRGLYKSIWPLHTDFITNRTALRTQLQQFDATIF